MEQLDIIPEIPLYTNTNETKVILSMFHLFIHALNDSYIHSSI